MGGFILKFGQFRQFGEFRQLRRGKFTVDCDFFQKIPQPVHQKQDALVLVLDLSYSMKSGDLAPSRIDRARQKLLDLLKQRKEGQTGLIAYAGDAHIVTPLTDDTDTIDTVQATIEALGDELRIGVVEGDLETENDAERIRAKGVAAVQIATGTACHLDAHMVHDALHEMNLDELDVLFIENVGNLVCPASFDLGHHHNVTLLSVTEGDDKPAKYPVMFRAADLVLLSKSDFLEVIDDFDPAHAERQVRELANPADVLQLSVRRPETLQAWFDWLHAKLDAHRAGAEMAPRTQPDGAVLHGVADGGS